MTEQGQGAVNQDDLDLAARILAGDEGAFGQLVTAHHASMVRVARSYVASDSVATEVAQEAWVAVLAGLARFEGRSSLKTWLFRILTNRAKTRGVREGRQVPFSALGEDDGGQPDLDPSRFNDRGGWAQPPSSWRVLTPEDLLERKELTSALLEAIEKLPARQRLVVTLRDIEGWDPDEVCNVLEISETNQRVILHRARTQLREILEQMLAGEVRAR
jgi:RNA polymerase sigma-70 factor (ECF subfamily)